MQNRALRVGPTALGTSVGNILNTGITSLSGPTGYTQTQPYAILTHIRVVNKTGTSANLSLFITSTSGGSAAGTEFAFQVYPVAAYSYVDWYGRVRLESTEYLTGNSSAATTLTFEAEGEIGLT